MKHTCHFHPCETPTPPAWLYCRKHWGMVPKNLQDALYDAHHRGAWKDSPTGKRRYFAAVRACMFAVREQLTPSPESV